MTCAQVQQELALAFPGEILSVEAQAHLQTCDACRAFRDDLLTLSRRIPAEPDENWLDIPAGLFVAAVNERIDVESNRHVAPSRWRQYVAAAAVLLLTTLSGAVGYRMGATDTDLSAGTTTPQTSDEDQLAEELAGELDADYVETMVADAGSGMYLQIEDMLLDELSEDEIRQLSESFNAGEQL